MMNYLFLWLSTYIYLKITNHRMKKMLFLCWIQMLCLHIATAKEGEFMMKVNDSTSFTIRLDSCVIDVKDSTSDQFMRKYCFVWDSHKNILVRKGAGKIVSDDVADGYYWVDCDVMNNVLADRDYDYLLSPNLELYWGFTKDKAIYEKRKCKRVRDFKKLVAPPFCYKGIIGECDVNEDGLTDYVIDILKSDCLQGGDRDSVNETKNGFILVINKGRYFETDIRNDACFHTYGIFPYGSYYAPDESIEISGKSFSVQYACGQYGWWTYNFSYLNGNYVLSSYHEGDGKRYYPIDHTMDIDFKNGVVTLWWENDAWEDDETSETSPLERQQITAYYSISGGAPLLITDYGDDEE